jgi:hypothetical protein
MTVGDGRYPIPAYEEKRREEKRKQNKNKKLEKREKGRKVDERWEA